MTSRASFTPCPSPLGYPPPTPQHHPNTYLHQRKMPSSHLLDNHATSNLHHHHHHHHTLPPVSSSSLSLPKQPSRSNTNSPVIPPSLYDRTSLVRSVSPQLTAQVMNNLIHDEVIELVKNLEEKGITVSQHLLSLW